MKNILHNLYHGNIIPWERRETNSEKRLALLRKLEREEGYFMEKLSPEDCQRFQALSSLHTELFTTEEEKLFSYGFSLGMLLAMDVMKESEVFSHG